jgi:hypothetical protein
VIYLTRRLADPVRLRATISGMILLSTGLRLLVFTGSGLVRRDQLAPARLVQLVRVLVLATGVSLLWRVM